MEEETDRGEMESLRETVHKLEAALEDVKENQNRVDRRMTTFERKLENMLDENATVPEKVSISGYFYIRSRMNNYVLDIRDGKTSVGSQVVSHSKNLISKDHQLWYEDSVTKQFKSKKAPHLCLAVGNDNKLTVLSLSPLNSDDDQRSIRMIGHRLHQAGKPSQVVHCTGVGIGTGTEVILKEWHGGANQQWDLVPYQKAGTPAGQTPAL